MDLIRYLVTKGHDLFLAKHETSAQYLPGTGEQLISLPFGSNEAQQPDKLNFITQLLDYIERHTRQLFIKSLENTIQEHSKDDASRTFAVANNTHSDISLDITKPEPTNISKPARQYMQTLHTIQHYQTTHHQEAKFESLLLRYYFNRLDSHKEAISTFINDTSNADMLLSFSDLVENQNDIIHAIEMSPKLLQKLYTAKKTLADNEESDVNQAQISGLIKIQSTMRYDVFCGIKDFSEEYDNGKVLVNKFYSHLVNCKFIRAASKNISGIKQHGNFIKFKLSNMDESLYTQDVIIDEARHCIYYIFDKIHNHKHKVSGSIKTIKILGPDGLRGYLGDAQLYSNNEKVVELYDGLQQKDEHETQAEREQNLFNEENDDGYQDDAKIKEQNPILTEEERGMTLECAMIGQKADIEVPYE